MLVLYNLFSDYDYISAIYQKVTFCRSIWAAFLCPFLRLFCCALCAFLSPLFFVRVVTCAFYQVHFAAVLALCVSVSTVCAHFLTVLPCRGLLLPSRGVSFSCCAISIFLLLSNFLIFVKIFSVRFFYFCQIFLFSLYHKIIVNTRILCTFVKFFAVKFFNFRLSKFHFLQALRNALSLPFFALLLLGSCTRTVVTRPAL